MASLVLLLSELLRHHSTDLGIATTPPPAPAMSSYSCAAAAAAAKNSGTLARAGAPCFIMTERGVEKSSTSLIDASSEEVDQFAEDLPRVCIDFVWP